MALPAEVFVYAYQHQGAAQAFLLLCDFIAR